MKKMTKVTGIQRKMGEPRRMRKETQKWKKYKKTLRAGWDGIVRRIDCNGDAQIDFTDFGEALDDVWVLQRHFSKLKVLEESKKIGLS